MWYYFEWYQCGAKSVVPANGFITVIDAKLIRYGGPGQRLLRNRFDLDNGSLAPHLLPHILVSEVLYE